LDKKKILLLLASISLILALLLSGCAGATPETEVVEKTVEKTVTETETVEVDKVYRCLNPRGEFIPVELNPIAPRIDSLDGKTVLFYASEGASHMLPVLYEDLKADYPTSTWDYIYTNNFGEGTPTEEQIAKYDAVIRGTGW
jgi:hypothetical protein